MLLLKSNHLMETVTHLYHIPRNDDVTVDTSEIQKNTPKLKKSSQHLSPPNVSNKSDQSTSSQNNQNSYSSNAREKEKEKEREKENNPQKRGPRRGGNPLPEWNDNSDFQPDMPSSAMKKLSPRNNSEGKILIIPYYSHEIEGLEKKIISMISILNFLFYTNLKIFSFNF